MQCSATSCCQQGGITGGPVRSYRKDGRQPAVTVNYYLIRVLACPSDLQRNARNTANLRYARPRPKHLVQSRIFPVATRGKFLSKTTTKGAHDNGKSLNRNPFPLKTDTVFPTRLHNLPRKFLLGYYIRGKKPLLVLL